METTTVDPTKVTEQDLLQMNLQCLGYINGWYDNPPELFEKAKGKNYKYYSFYTGRCETTVYCPEGGFYYLVDSSD